MKWVRRCNGCNVQWVPKVRRVRVSRRLHQLHPPHPSHPIPIPTSFSAATSPSISWGSPMSQSIALSIRQHGRYFQRPRPSSRGRCRSRSNKSPSQRVVGGPSSRCLSVSLFLQRCRWDFFCARRGLRLQQSRNRRWTRRSSTSPPPRRLRRTPGRASPRPSHLTHLHRTQCTYRSIRVSHAMHRVLRRRRLGPRQELSRCANRKRARAIDARRC